MSLNCGVYQSLISYILCSINLISEGPQAMLKGALLYGGMIYVFSGAGRRGTLPPEEYTDAPVDF